MRWRNLLYLLMWAATLPLLGGLFGLAYLVHRQMSAERAAEAGGDTIQVPKRAANGVVKLGAELAESLGIKDEPAQEAQWHQRVPVYGRVVPNPRATAEVRAAFAGTLRTAAGGAWPALGGRVQAGQVLGRLDVRVGPQERLDLQAKLNDARLKELGAKEVLQVQQERVNRFKSVGPSVPQGELDTALVQCADAKTQLATAAAAVKQWEDALAAIDQQGGRTDAVWGQTITAPAGGEVTDLAGRPDMAVEAGALIARLVDFRRALVRLDVPLQALAAGPPPKVELFVAAAAPPALEGPTNRPEPGGPAPPVPAVLVGIAPQVEAASQLAGCWYEVDTAAAGPAEGGGAWRPGLFVKAYVKALGDKPRPAVAVPATALLYHQGRALVYVRLAPGRYERREVQALGQEGGCWLLAAGVTAGEPVVSRRAQVLLSEEFRGEADND